MTFDLVGTRKWLYVGSGLMVVVAIVLLAIPPALRPGIEFTSGSTTLLRFEKPVEENRLRGVYAELGHPEVRIQITGENQFLVRTRELRVPPGSFSEVAPSAQNAVQPVGPLPPRVLGTLTLGAQGATGNVPLRRTALGIRVGGELADPNDACNLGNPVGEAPAGTQAQVIERNTNCPGGEVFRVIAGDVAGYVQAKDTTNFVAAGDQGAQKDQGERTVVENRLRETFGKFEVLEFASVSPIVSRAAVRNAAVAVVIAAVFILVYLALAFSGVPRPFRYGVCAIVALGHDVIVTLGFFSLFGKVLGTEVNLMFVTGLLTVIGFSVHDSIVVFDRIRENIRLSPHAPLHDNVNAALLQTMARSLNTSITVLITVAAMLALGGVTIQSFLLVILVGIIAGAYSSIGIASQLLVSWEEGDFRRFAFWRRRGGLQQAEG